MTGLRDALQSQDFALTATLSMARGKGARDLVAEAQYLSESVDAIQIPDSPGAHPHISSIAAAALIIREGIDPIVHMKCRDRNRIAIQSDLLGAHALGITNILLMRGTRLPADIMPPANNVFDMGELDFIRTAAAIRDNEDLVGGKLPGVPDLYVGAVGTAFRPEESWQPDKLLAKIDAGAQFIQLKVSMNALAIQKYTAKIVATKVTWRTQILANLAIFQSADDARELQRMRPNTRIPREVIARLENSDDSVQEGIDICAEILTELANIPGIAGANIATSGEPESIRAVIEKSGIRSN